MKKIILIPALLVAFCCSKVNAQESFGRTLNLGLGVGYYGYVGHSLPVLNVNYEFDVARNFTLAPFVTIYSYRNYRYWGNPNTPYRDYYYRETVVPFGLKGTYYFDELFNAGPKWDFYAGGSLGFAVSRVVWENGYDGNRDVTQRAWPLYLDAHAGAELHLNENIGLFLDLSSGVSTFGLAFH